MNWLVWNLFPILSSYAITSYNRPDCSSWPNAKAWQTLSNDLGVVVTTEDDNNNESNNNDNSNHMDIWLDWLDTGSSNSTEFFAKSNNVKSRSSSSSSDFRISSSISNPNTKNKLFAVNRETGMELFAEECMTKGSNSYAIASSGNGICMQNFVCRYQFCNIDQNETYYLPDYTVDIRSELDLQIVLQFANTHNIPVSIKTSGHSYTASSTSSNSILLWMAHYPQDGTITTAYHDSCNNTYDQVIGIGGGTTWNYVIDHVKDKYHVVTGASRTVAAAGGYVHLCAVRYEI
jgi:FAD binding domain